MTLLERFIHKPRSFAARGWMFQIHLWTGLLLALYGLVIGVTGSALVFAPEYEDWQVRNLLHASGPGKAVTADRVLESVAAAYPDASISSLFLPVREQETFRVWLLSRQDRRQHEVFVDPVTARRLGERIHGGGFLNWLEQLHFNLLGGRTGNIVNGVAALLLVVLCATGLMIWWPGQSHWARAMSINWSLRWKRLNYDIHSAVGFFALAFVLLLALTGAYFASPQATRDVIARFVPMKQGRPAPAVRAPTGTRKVPIQQLLDRAAASVPGSWLELITIPNKPGQAARVYLMSGGIREYHKTSTVDLDPNTGAVLQVQREKGRTMGDALIAWLPALHFGSFGGVPVKILWVLLGLSPAVLGVSGAIMWWNRVGARRLRAYRSRRRLAGTVMDLGAREEAYSLAALRE